jgi:hypothetical protein
MKKLMAAVCLLAIIAGVTVVMKKHPSPLNRAANPGSASSEPAGPVGFPAGYTLITSTDLGKALSTNKAGAATVQAALESTLPDLDHYFGVKSTVGSAYQDAKDSKSGGATFCSTLNGQPIKGIISCKLEPKGAAVAVIFARANTSKAEWDKLISPAQTDSTVPEPEKAPPPVPAQPVFPLKEFDFADGSGSIQLADGWTTKAQTCINPVLIVGPAKQNIVLNNMMRIETPDSPAQQLRRRNEQMQEQMAARARAQGRPFTPFPAPPGPPPLVAPYCEPVDALKTMLPQFSKVNEYNHGPTTTLDKIISVKDAPCGIQGGKAALIQYAYTETLNGEQTHFRRSVYLQTAPQGQIGWTWCVTGVAAPDATFDHDAPLMFAMVNSLKINQAQWTANLNAQTQSNLQNIAVLGAAENQALATQAQMGRDNLNTQNAIHQEQHQAQMDSYAKHNAQWAADETQKQRNTADYIETIKGTRMIYDTKTGASGYANLGDVNGVVDALNHAALDPNRFVQVPLRDYLYAPTPVPTR